MAREGEHIFSFRAEESLVIAVTKFAHDAGLYTIQGKPNVSLALKILVGIGLQDFDGQELNVTAMNSARAALLYDVRLKMNDMLSELIEDVNE